MRVVTLVKAPLRAARAVYRGLRGQQEAELVRPTPTAAPPPATPPPATAPPVTQPPPPRAAPSPAAPPARPITVEVEGTPNPAARKFVCSVPVAAHGSVAFDSAAAAAAHPVGAALFAIPGVKTVFAVRDFVTVTRAPEATWDALEPRIVATLKQTLSS